MSSGSNIQVVGTDRAPQTLDEMPETSPEDLTELGEELTEEWDDENVRPGTRDWIAPTAALLIIAGWTGFYGLTVQSKIIAGATLQQWSDWIIGWSVPVMLVAMVWILASRNSTREAERFGDAARTLSVESAALETRLSVINRELSIAREFLGSQSRDLESLGRVAGERLSDHADHLQGLIRDNSAQVDAIATISATALENMVRLRDDLPVIANSARDVTNNIGNAGRIAHEQTEELLTGFRRLNEFGEASEQQVSNLQASLDAALAQFEANSARMDAVTGNRFEALRASGEELRADLDKYEVEALAALRRRADALMEEMNVSQSSLREQEDTALFSLRTRYISVREESRIISQSVRDTEERAITAWNGHVDEIKERLIAAIEHIASLDDAALTSSAAKLQELSEEAQRVDAVMAERGAALEEQVAIRRGQMSQDEQEAIENLRARLAGLDEAITARREGHMWQSDQLTESAEAISGRLMTLGANLDAAAEQSSTITNHLIIGADTLSDKLNQNRQRIDETIAAVAGLTEDTFRLLELIQASSEQSRKVLPVAIGDARDQIAAAEDQVNQIKSVLGEAKWKSAELSEYVLEAKDNSRGMIDQIEQYHAQMTAANAEHYAEVDQLGSSLEELSACSASLSDTARSELRDAITMLKQSTQEAFGEIQSGTAVDVTAIAQRIGNEAARAIDEALRNKTAEVVTELEDAIAKAGAAGCVTTSTLRDQLGKVNELTSNLEARVNRARERAEEQVDHDFSRRVALITESLNSNAIDISKAMSHDVTDTAWSSYLRGDRGIFTRRAVQLLDNTEAREIAEVYAADGAFAENVSRYIHDFEAMLRVMLSTRDGNALGVTLLSSDMGKLYVALAQAIERLRN